MRPVNHKELINLPVETRNGDFLGKIASLEIDTDSQSIVSYNVEYSNILKRILKDKLLISRNQVISIESDKMLVEGNVLTEQARQELLTHPKALPEKPNVIQSKIK